jgi:hypothetical protein
VFIGHAAVARSIQDVSFSPPLSSLSSQLMHVYSQVEDLMHQLLQDKKIAKATSVPLPPLIILPLTDLVI